MSKRDSVDIVLDGLDRLGMRKVGFAKRLGVSPEYVYRILNRKVAFPGIVETLDRMANILEIDPQEFPEYVAFHAYLTPSVSLVWKRMRELGLSREVLFASAMDGQISRPYFYGILRGDHPFPTNRGFIHLFARALKMDPAGFPEYAAAREPRWSREDAGQLDLRFHMLLVDAMLKDRGYSTSFDYELITPAMVEYFFLPDEEYEPIVRALFTRMGEWDYGVDDVAKRAGVAAKAVMDLCFGDVEPETIPEEMERLRVAMELG